MAHPYCHADCLSLDGLFHFGPRTLGQATTELYKGVMRIVQNDPLGIDFVTLNQILLKVMILYLISTLLDLLQGYLLANVSAKISYQLRKESPRN